MRYFDVGVLASRSLLVLYGCFNFPSCNAKLMNQHGPVMMFVSSNKIRMDHHGDILGPYVYEQNIILHFVSATLSACVMRVVHSMLQKLQWVSRFTPRNRQNPSSSKQSTGVSFSYLRYAIVMMIIANTRYSILDTRYSILANPAFVFKILFSALAYRYLHYTECNKRK